MQTVTFRCPSCHQIGRSALETDDPITCNACNFEVARQGRRPSDERLDRCTFCGSPEMFVRKDFPQRLGVTIVIVGIAASCVTWYYEWIITTYAIFFGSALVDVILYFCMANVLECYRCHAHFRGIPELESHAAFDLEIHEKNRQHAARMKDVEANRTRQASQGKQT